MSKDKYPIINKYIEIEYYLTYLYILFKVNSLVIGDVFCYNIYKYDKLIFV